MLVWRDVTSNSRVMITRFSFCLNRPVKLTNASPTGSRESASHICNEQKEYNLQPSGQTSCSQSSPQREGLSHKDTLQTGDVHPDYSVPRMQQTRELRGGNARGQSQTRGVERTKVGSKSSCVGLAGSRVPVSSDFESEPRDRNTNNGLVACWSSPEDTLWRKCGSVLTWGTLKN